MVNSPGGGMKRWSSNPQLLWLIRHVHLVYIKNILHCWGFHSHTTRSAERKQDTANILLI